MKRSLGILVVLVLLGGAAAVWMMARQEGPPPVQRAGEGAEQPGTALGGQPQLNVYNWSDYIAGDTIDNFEREYGIRVNYDVFDSNEVLEAKLLAGSTGFDIVVPSSSFLARQIKAGVFMELDVSKLSNYGNLDPEIMKIVGALDPDNRYSVPYLWGTTGIGYNPDKVAKALGADAPTDSWDLVMNPENLQKLHKCGVSFLDAPTEVIPAVLKYLGEDPNSFDVELIASRARAHLLSLRPYITYMHSSQYISDLANGDVCVSVGWSGDILQAKERAAEANSGVRVEYVIPEEGAAMWFDMLAIPGDAPHPDNAHLFIDYLLRPQVIAAVSDAVFFANPNAASFDLISTEVSSDPSIYPPGPLADFYTFKLVPPEVDRAYTSVWRSFQRGKQKD